MDWDIDKRYLLITIATEEGGKREQVAEFTTSAAVSFNTSQSVSGSSCEGNITIKGMHAEKMAFLATTSTQWLKTAKRNFITIQAGYEESGYGVIFEGVIHEATAKIEKANYTLTIKAMAQFGALADSVKSYSFPGKWRASRLINEFAKDMRLVFINEIKDKNKIPVVEDFQSKDKSIISCIREVAGIAAIDAFINGGKVIVKERGQASGRLPAFIVDNNNLVGSFNPTPQGVKFAVRMTPGITTGAKVIIKSERYKILNDVVFVLQSLNHSGDTRGKDWATSCTCYRLGVWDNQAEASGDVLKKMKNVDLKSMGTPPDNLKEGLDDYEAETGEDSGQNLVEDKQEEQIHE